MFEVGPGWFFHEPVRSSSARRSTPPHLWTEPSGWFDFSQPRQHRAAQRRPAREAARPQHASHQPNKRLRRDGFGAAAATSSKADRDPQRRQRQAAALLRGAHKAAITVQRWWRQHRVEDHAARVVQRAVRARAFRAKMTRVLDAMAAVRRVQAEMQQLEHEHAAVCRRLPSTDKRVLGFVDAVEKAILKIDAIATHGATAVRHRRKAVVTYGQRLLKSIGDPPMPMDTDPDQEQEQEQEQEQRQEQEQQHRQQEQAQARLHRHQVPITSGQQQQRQQRFHPVPRSSFFRGSYV